MPSRDVDVEPPSTLRRSPREAQQTSAPTVRSAIDEYGDGERAPRTAYASFEHSLDKVGDDCAHDEQRCPSDAAAAGAGGGATFGGMDVRASRAHLVELARWLDVHVTTRMTRAEIAAALEKESDRRSARSRGR